LLKDVLGAFWVSLTALHSWKIKDTLLQQFLCDLCFGNYMLIF